jgi:hypothetical protein
MDARLTFCLLLFTCALSAQTENPFHITPPAGCGKTQTDLQKDNLSGAIQAITDTILNFSSYSPDTSAQYFITQYNRTGNITDKKYTPYGGTHFLYHYIYRYDNPGNSLALIDSSFNEIISQTRYVYSPSADTLTAIKEFRQDKPDTAIFIFDKRGNLTCHVAATGEHLPWQVALYKYDDQCRPMEGRFYSKDTLQYSMIYQRADSLHSIQTIYFSNGKVKAQLFDTISYVNGLKQLMHCRKYSDSMKWTLIKYDKMGNQLVNGKDQVFKYTYDVSGNWIKRLEFFDNALSTVTLRGISYYPPEINDKKKLPAR